MLTITLPPDLDERLADEARQRGTSPELLAIDMLRRAFVSPEVPAEEGGTLYDFLGDFIGSIEGTGESLSKDCGRHFADGVEEKYRQRKP
jgi:hypothetical protein